jgi:hypothetical protein
MTNHKKMYVNDIKCERDASGNITDIQTTPPPSFLAKYVGMPIFLMVFYGHIIVIGTLSTVLTFLKRLITK